MCTSEPSARLGSNHSYSLVLPPTNEFVDVSPESDVARPTRAFVFVIQQPRTTFARSGMTETSIRSAR